MEMIWNRIKTANSKSKRLSGNQIKIGDFQQKQRNKSALKSR